MTRAYLSIDIGTSATKGVLVDRGGATVDEVRRPHEVHVPGPARAEHDATAIWWDGVADVARSLTEAAARNDLTIAGVCVSGIGPCVLPVDENHRPLRPAILYGVDGRAGTQIDRLVQALGEDEIVARCGTGLSSQSAGPKILWIEENEPDISARTWAYVTSTTFVVLQLTGRLVIDHGTAAYFHPLYDRRTNAWNLAGVPTDVVVEQLPEIRWAHELAGVVTAGASAATGIPEGTPVLVGGADSPLEALAAGVVSPGMTMLMYGSSHFVISLSDGTTSSGLLWRAPYLWSGPELMAGGTATAGTFLQWLCTILDGSGGSSLSSVELAELAVGSVPGADGLVALPYVSGERTPLFDPGARGVILGLAVTHSRADIARAGIEAVAQSAVSVLDIVAREAGGEGAIRAVGGGTRNEVWVQAVSDISGRDQEVVDNAGAAFGGAMLAAHAVERRSLESIAREWVRLRRTVSPRRELNDLYRQQRQRFGALYGATRSLLHGGRVQ